MSDEAPFIAKVQLEHNQRKVFIPMHISDLLNLNKGDFVEVTIKKRKQEGS